MILSKSQIESAAKAICNSRELCGNERDAFNQWCADNNIKPNNALYAQANFRAGSIWRNYQITANVPVKYVY